MPITPQNNQLAQLQQQMQQQQQMQMLMPMIQKLMQAQQAGQPGQPGAGAAAASPTGQGQGLGALLGGQSAMQGQGSPPTLGMGGGLPMQMAPADPQGQQQQPPLPPDPTAMGQ